MKTGRPGTPIQECAVEDGSSKAAHPKPARVDVSIGDMSRIGPCGTSDLMSDRRVSGSSWPPGNGDDTETRNAHGASREGREGHPAAHQEATISRRDRAGERHWSERARDAGPFWKGCAAKTVSPSPAGARGLRRAISTVGERSASGGQEAARGGCRTAGDEPLGQATAARSLALKGEEDHDSSQ